MSQQARIAVDLVLAAAEAPRKADIHRSVRVYSSVLSVGDGNALGDSLEAVLVAPARDERWRRYEQESVGDVYLDALVGAGAHKALVSEPFRAAA